MENPDLKRVQEKTLKWALNVVVPNRCTCGRRNRKITLQHLSETGITRNAFMFLPSLSMLSVPL